jgi:hypothetical protein
LDRGEKPSSFLKEADEASEVVEILPSGADSQISRS